LAEERMVTHATCVAVGKYGVLIIGPPGAGKSDLALRLIDCAGRGSGTKLLAARLVSDDQTLILRRGTKLIGTAIQSIAGKLEIRGLGIVDVPHQAEAQLSLAVQIEPASQIDRMPNASDRHCAFCGINLPEVSVDAASASAPARIRAALGHLVGR
jgi:HPr kinase/phosphorylase